MGLTEFVWLRHGGERGEDPDPPAESGEGQRERRDLAADGQCWVQSRQVFLDEFMLKLLLTSRLLASGAVTFWDSLSNGLWGQETQMVL